MSPPAKQRGGIIAPLSAARTAQRAVPTRFRVQSAKISWNSFHEPGRLRVADPRSGPRLCEAQRFMVPSRDSRIVEAFHEPLRTRQAQKSSGTTSELLYRNPFFNKIETWNLKPTSH